MTRDALPRIAGWIAAASLCGGAAPATISAQTTAAWRITGGDVRVVCPMTVGGSFEARTSALAGEALAIRSASSDPSSRSTSLPGQLAVDLATLDTGIELRNRHMRETYLEVQKGHGFDHAVVSDISLNGANPTEVNGRVRFTGRLLLHGVTRPVNGEVTIHRTGSGLQVEARFPVRLPDFGIAKPRYLGVGVRDEVEVNVEFEAAPDAPDGAGSR